MKDAENVLALNGIKKLFLGVLALDGVNLNNPFFNNKQEGGKKNEVGIPIKDLDKRVDMNFWKSN